MRAGPRLAVLILLLALGGCAGTDPPVVITTPTTPRLTRDAIIAEDGMRLPLRAWLPQGETNAVVLAVHGFNDYSHAFAGPGAAWAKNGIATYAYDQRGFGATPDRGFWVGTERLDADLSLASRLLHRRYPDLPLYLLGESMGGAVVITDVAGAAGAPPPIATGIILVAPAVWGRATMNIFERVALWTANKLVPGLELSGRGLGIEPSDNLPMLIALSHDPMVIKETRVDTLNGLVNLMDLALAAAPKIDKPVFLLYGEHDQIIPADPIQRMIAHLPPAYAKRQRIAWYPEGYHMLLRDLDAPLVISDVESWIADPEAPLPSGADRRVAKLMAARE